ncbi:MAG: thermonuclease family protein [Oscillospiraceae bacterium]|nr:thermonuclease family protein [Oscillospiraceae bacterium]
MMKKRIFALLAALCIALGCLAGCGGNPAGNETTLPAEESTTAPAQEFVDYAGSVELDMESETAKCQLTVAEIKGFVDGDTTHFYVPTSVSENGLLKARYLAVNTPESTGKIEEWGKKASSFTKEKLSTAVEIVLESDDANWNLDSTGGRHLVWVWYRPEGSTSYRNLNIELLQNGLSIASNSAENRYGETCMAAIAQAKAQKLHMHSNETDPDFYYGEALPVTLKHLRTNIELYENMKVAFEGVITRESGQTVYVEEYDPETDMYYGMNVYYGYNLTGTGLEILEPGNRVAFVGSVQYYATGDSWQVSDIKYVDMRPNDPNNIQLVSSGHEPAHTLTTPELFTDGTVEVEVMTDLSGEETTMETFPYAKLALGTSIAMENMKVDSVYTTSNEDSASKGAMTLTCYTKGYKISVRTTVMRDADGNLITADAYEGKIINVKGVVDVFSGTYQIKVFSPEDITIIG